MIVEDIAKYFVGDHRRLESLLERSFHSPDSIDLDAYGEFRKGLLRHIALEEKILFPQLAGIGNGEPFPGVNILRLEHGALAALLVHSPTENIHRALATILNTHNAAEERTGGMYAACRHLESAVSSKLGEKLDRYPPVPVSPYNDKPGVLEAAERALARAGYSGIRLI